MFKIDRGQLQALFQLIAKNQELYLPVKQAGKVNFANWGEDAEVDLDVLNSVKSPKDAFFPQSENLYTCKREGKRITVEAEELKDQDFVIFGMRACDVKGVEVLDKVFLSEPVDSFYKARREHGTIVALACGEPEETCFCEAFDIDATSPKADVTTWLIADSLYWQANTLRGEQLTSQVENVLTKCEDKTVKEQQKATEEILKKLPYAGISLAGWNGAALTEKFDSKLWEELYKPCLACGTCTFICPTCQCYDIKDYNTGHDVKRYRCWDSCMYSDFTMMAHGNNRTSQMQRFRQRFMHKLVYFPDNNEGMYSCVGCGRCVSKCPASLNIVKVIKAFEEKGGGA